MWQWTLFFVLCNRCIAILTYANGTCERSKYMTELNILDNDNPDLAHLVKDVLVNTEDMYCLDDTFCSEIQKEIEKIYTKDSVTKLHITVSGDPTTERPNELSMNWLRQVPSLEELWLVNSDLSNTLKEKETYKYLYSRSKNRTALNMKKLHIDSMQKSKLDDRFYDFIDDCDMLEVFHYSNAVKLWDCMSYSQPNNILWALQGKPLRSLVLKNFQNLLCNLDMNLLFEPLKASSVEYLDLSRNKLFSFTGGIVDIFPKLKALDLSHNQLAVKYFKHSFPSEVIELFLHPTIVLLLMQYQNSNSNVWAYRQHSSLTHSRKTRNLHTDVSACLQQYKSNSTIWKRYPISRILCFVLSCLHTSIPCESLPTDLLDLSCVSNIRLPIGRNIAELNFNYLQLDSDFDSHYYQIDTDEYNSKLCLTESNNIRRISIRGNGLNFKRNHFNHYSMMIIEGLHNLTYFDIGDNQLDLKQIFHSLSECKQLSTLLADGNTISFQDDQVLCNTLPRLEMLNISEGNITHLPQDLFLGCKYLKEVSLSNNNIEQVELNLTGCTSLQKIHLRNTQLKEISKSTRMILDRIALSNDIQLDLTGTQLSCHCDHLETVHWLQNTKVTIKDKCTLICVDPNGAFETNPLCNFDAKEILRNHCQHLDVIISVVSTAVLMLVVLSLVLIIHKYRYNIKTKIQRMRRQFYKHSLANEDRTSEDFDAYIHYAGPDRHFVHGDLLTELKDKHGFKIIIRFRDFQIGPPVADLIARSIKMSRASIIILSKHTSANEWMEYSINQAVAMEANHHKKLIWIKLGDIDVEVQPEVIQNVLNNMTAYHVRTYPELNEKKIPLFYEKIVSELHDVPECSKCSLCCFSPCTNYSNLRERSLMMDPVS